MDLFSPENLDIFLKLFISLSLGSLIGTERWTAGKTAGMKTYAMVSMGSTLFTIISIIGAQRFSGNFALDPLRTVSQIVVGIGFIGAGLIILKDDKLFGLTTAAGLWVAGGLGVAVGYGLYVIAIYTTLLTLFVFVVLRRVEILLRKRRKLG